MITVTKLKKVYNNIPAVKEISFTLSEGQALGIIGANGAGKSTTIKCIIGLITPTSGTITINNKQMNPQAYDLKQIIGYMPEESMLYEDLTATQFLAFFAELYKVPKELARQRAATLLSELKLENKLISTMSKGMKRKLLIARSLIADPKLLVYDEPASGIDPETTQTILSYIESLKKKGKIIILTGHNLHHVERISDRIIMLNKGEVVFDDTIYSIKQNKKYVLRYKKEGEILTKEYTTLSTLNNDLEQYIKEGAMILDFQQKEPTLEELFLSIVRQEQERKKA